MLDSPSSPEPAIPTKRKYDYTTLSCAQRCTAEYVLRHVRGLKNPLEESAALKLGGAVHAGLRAFYNSASLEECVSRVEDEWRVDGAPDELPDEPYRSLSKAREIMVKYAEHYPPSKWGFKVLRNEEWVEGKLYGAIVDRVIERAMDGQVYAMDTKTTSLYMGESTLKRYEAHLQPALQIQVVEEKLGVKLAGFCYDGIYVGRRHDVRESDFGRFWIPYSEGRKEQLMQVASTVSFKARVFSGVGTTRLVRNPESCVRWNKLCPFWKYCWASDEDREKMIELALATGELVEEEWNPATAR